MRKLINPWAIGGAYWKANVLQNSVLDQNDSNFTNTSDQRIRTIRNARKDTIGVRMKKVVKFLHLIQAIPPLQESME
ncbi:hypothetical protein GC167_00580 [bacterium]|nr:hypothetical protein [bacterium]